MADEPQIESGEARNPGEILDIRFQKNTNHKQKYLEAEPKILGVTQIALAVFFISVTVVLRVHDIHSLTQTALRGTFSMTRDSGQTRMGLLFNRETTKATSSLTSLNTELTRRRLNVNRENTYSPASLTRDAFQKAVQNADTEFAFNSENTD
ncbi:membrane-spanning 4-domains subfamily A member 4A-like [Pimephales promelas]|nr:membrane-spanning 4-domains subfamily A member 4A-like [Pimephales promelas]